MDYIVYEELPGGGLSEPRYRAKSEEEAMSWARKKALDWYVAGHSKRYHIHYNRGNIKCGIVQANIVKGIGTNV